MRDQFALRVKQEEGRCVHFTGIQHDECKAAVKYKSFPPGALPCLNYFANRQTPDTCAKREYPTHEQAETRLREHDAALEKFLAKLREGKNCPHCDAPIESTEIVGRCKYANPCGHRLGQVGAPEKTDAE